MHLRLWQRLFIAFATLSVLALAGLAVWQQQSFRRGFLGYLDDVALERLQPASVRVANAYAEQGSWNFLRDRPDLLNDLIDDRRGRVERRILGNDSDLAPPPPGDAGGAPPGPPPNEMRGPRDGPRPPPHGPQGLMPRLVLLDADGRRVVGRADVPAGAPEVPVELAGRRIGTLRLAPLPQFDDAIDVAFAHEQLRTALLAAIAVLVGSLVVAFALARWLLRPMLALGAGTRALAAGDYSSRLPTDRHDELGRLARDFNHLASTLEQHRESRRRWGADIAHELRTPLSILRGEIQALQDGVRAPTPVALDSLHAECERLGSLIEDLYQLSLADAGALDYRFESLDLGEVARDALDLQRRVCADAGLVLEEAIADGIVVRGDARRLTQLTDNLIANARRYTDAPGRIRVEVSATEDGAALVIEDTAPGVPDSSLPRLFDRLYRVEGSRSRAAGGAGLGLAICRAIVEAHGGHIEAMPSPLGGLRVRVELPRDGA